MKIIPLNVMMIAAGTLFVTAAVAYNPFHVKPQVPTLKVCDASLVLAANGVPVDRVTRAYSGIVYDSGNLFRIEYEFNRLTSPILIPSDGVMSGTTHDGVIFVKRNGTYQVTNDGVRWIYFDNCVEAKTAK